MLTLLWTFACAAPLRPAEPPTPKLLAPPRDSGARLTWRPGANETRLEVVTLPEQEIHLRFRAMLGELESSWSNGPYVTDARGRWEQPVSPPPQAFLHPVAVDYLTDLVVMVELGGHRARSDTAYLAWPDGPTAPARIWTRTEAFENAPNGVFDASLRVGLAPEERLLPNVSDVAAERSMPTHHDTGAAP
jgi:hypothetical protein